VFHLVLPRVYRLSADNGPAGRRLLVIEGDDKHQSRLFRVASDAGFSVDSVGTGQAALRSAQAVPYTALALALRLPDAGGLETLAGIRKAGASQGSPVLGLSVRAAPGRVATLPVDDLLSKPLRTDEVALALDRLGLGRPARIMVVDDDPLARQLMHSHLASAGHTVTPMPGGREAIEALRRDRHDAVILDLMMPGFDGFETLDALRRMPAMRDLPVFIWTCLMLTDDELVSLSRSADAVLVKGGGELEPLVRALQRWRSMGVDVAGSA
jgi:DNA-binding response OmpR family regulator